MTEYQKAFRGLNDKQRQAVETTSGPVLVVAGPGTGKTQLLSTRVAYILRHTDTKPNNILCLTYTNKAAVNMKDRIIELAGQEGTRVPASTFHSFAGEIMNLYPDYFWNAARLSIAPDSVQLDIIESIIAKLPLDSPLSLKFAGQYTLLKDIQSAIGLAKDAGLTPDKLRALIEFNLSYINKIESKFIKILNERLTVKKLPALSAEVEGLTKQEIKADLYPLTELSTLISNSLAKAMNEDLEAGKCTQTSQWKIRWLQTVNGQRGMFNERQRNQWWLNLAEVYEQYRTELHRRGFYDFADMLVEVVAQLDQNPEILADIQERFSYVLVDEFQDNTPAQLRFAHLVASHYSAEGKPNLMVVGDDDQTIFRFNGAEVNNMLNFERYYPSTAKIVLSDNYRSTQAILNFAKQIIEPADSRLVKLDPSLKKDLQAKQPPKHPGGSKTIAYSSSELQMSEIARGVQKRYRPTQTMAVLARNHDSLIKMAGILQRLKVPIRYEQAANILDHEIINQTYLVTKLLLAIDSGDRQIINGLVHQILRWPAWGLPPRQLWQLAADNYPDKDWLESLLASKYRAVRAMGDWFVYLAKVANHQPLAVTIEQIIGLRDSEGFTSPIRDYFCSTNKDQANAYFHGLSAIQLLRNLVHEFGLERQPRLTDLVRYVEINKLNDIIIPDESPFITGTKAVQLLTVHKAKGLEFDHVYIIDAIDDNWRPRVGGRKPPANLPLQPVGEDFDDYMRLMYVAVSRARASVTISSFYQDHSGQDVNLCSIIQGVKPFARVSIDDRRQLITVLEENLRWPQLEAGDERAILNARLENFNLNVTHLLDFLDIVNSGPQHFKERHLLRLPQLQTSKQAFGTAMHDALYQAQALANKKRLNLKAVIAEFKTSLTNEQLPSLEHKRYLAKGQQTLKRLFSMFKYELPPGSLAEYRLRDIRLGKASLSGTLDRLDKADKTTIIVDYKTGRPLSSFDTKDKNQALKAYKHRLQLIFYALLLEAKDGSYARQISGQMVYVETDDAKKLSRSYTPTQEDKSRLKALIEVVWDRILRLEFPDVSSYKPDIEGIKQFENDLLKGSRE